jgi:outer membrane protein assembly factor BamB
MDFSDADEEAYLPSEDILEEYSLSNETSTSPTVEAPGDHDSADEGETISSSEIEDLNDTSRMGKHPMCLFSGIEGEAYSAQLYPKSDKHSWLVCGGGDDKAYLYDYASMENLKEFGPFGDSVISTEFFGSDSDLLLIASMNGKIVIHDIGKDIQTSVEGPEEIVWCKAHPTANAIFAGSSDGSLWIWQVFPSKPELPVECIHVLGGHSGPIDAFDFSFDGKHIITGDESGNVLCWRLKDGTITQKYNLNDPITCIACHTKSDVASIGTLSGKCHVVSISSHNVLFKNEASSSSSNSNDTSVEAMTFTNNTLVVSNMSGLLLALDSNSFAERWRLPLHEGVTQIRTLKGINVLIGLSNGSILMVDVRSGQIIERYMGSTDGPTTLNYLSVHGDSKFIAAFLDGNVQVYSAH